MKEYYPILMAKKGELDALIHLKQESKNKICPILQITNKMLEKNEFEKKQKGEGRSGKRVLKGIIYKDDIEKVLKTHWNFANNRIILDFSLFEDFSNKIQDISTLLKNISNTGVNPILAIQQNSPKVYINFVKEFVKSTKSNICIRISNNSGGFRGINGTIEGLIKEVGVSTTQTIILLDFGFITREQIQLSLLTGEGLISLVNVNDWCEIVFASGSFPKDLSEFKTDLITPITRYEWLLWKDLHGQFQNIKYGDYGNRHPIYIVSNDSFEGSISIRYTCEDEFVVCRGVKSSKHAIGHGQYISHCAKLVNSRYYSGAHFSYGDLAIDDAAKKTLPKKGEKAFVGNPTKWIEYCQNHHFELLASLI